MASIELSRGLMIAGLSLTPMIAIAVLFGIALHSQDEKTATAYMYTLIGMIGSSGLILVAYLLSKICFKPEELYEEQTEYYARDSSQPFISF